MNQPAIVNVVQGDQLYEIDFELQNTDGSVFDMTGWTAVINAQAGNSSGKIFTHSLSVKSPSTNGVVAYIVQAGDFAEATKINAAIVATNTDTEAQVTFPNIQFIVQASIPTF